MTCNNCGTSNDPNAKYCASCGSSLTAVEANTASDDGKGFAIASLVLGIVLQCFFSFGKTYPLLGITHLMCCVRLQ